MKRFPTQARGGAGEWPLRPRRRHRVTAVAIAGVLASLVPSVGSGAQPSDLHVAIGGDGSGWGLAGDAVVGPQKGSWTADPVLDGSRLRIHVRVQPPEVNPILTAGPATLVTSVQVGYGLRHGGDIGYGRALGSTTTPLAGCTSDPCAYATDVTVPLKPAQAFIARTDDIESPTVTVGFTIVRSFGHGGWIQLLTPLDSDEQSPMTLESVRPVSGWIPQEEVIPAGDARIWGPRRGRTVGVGELSDVLGLAGDASNPVPTVVARVDVSLAGCDRETSVQLVDPWATVPLASSVPALPVHSLISLPDRTSWSLLVGTTTIGRFDTSGSDLAVTASVDCTTGPKGHLEATTSSEPRVQPPVPVPWQVSIESGRRAEPANPSLPVAFGHGFIVVGRSHGRGWGVDRSTDGVRWRTVRNAELPPSLTSNAVVGPLLTGSDDRLVLAGIVRGADGGDRFVAWSSGDARHWAPSTVKTMSADAPSATSLALRALVASDAGWFALADGDGSTGAFAWTSADGRTWSAMNPRMPHSEMALVTVAAGSQRLLGVARPDDPALPDLLVTSADGRAWTELNPLPASGAMRVFVGETSSGTVIVALERSSVAPIETWTSIDDGSTWLPTLGGSSAQRLEGLSVHDQTVIVTGSVRYDDQALESVPWAAVSQDAGGTWRVELPLNGFGDGLCRTVAAVGDTVAILTVSDCSADPVPRWRAVLDGPWRRLT